MNLVQRMIQKKHLIGVNLRHPRRALNSLLTLLSFKLKWLKPLGQPVAVDIEPTNFCNLKCQHCQVSNWQKPKHRLTMHHLNSWIKQFKTASRIKLQGMGEPFLNKELPSIIKQLEKDHFYIEVVSNGTIMNQEIYEVVTQTHNFNLTISFDGADKKTFESIRLGSDFDEIKSNLIKIIQAKPRHSKVSAAMVGFEEHQEQITPTMALMADLGVDGFTLQLSLINFGQDAMNEKTIGRRIKMKNQTDPFKKELYELARQKGLNMVIADTLFDEQNPCPWPWLGTYIDTEGYVIPCCHIGNAEICNFGNLNQQDFRTIWYSKEYQHLREQIRTSQIPHYCRSCYQSVPFERE